MEALPKAIPLVFRASLSYYLTSIRSNSHIQALFSSHSSAILVTFKHYSHHIQAPLITSHLKMVFTASNMLELILFVTCSCLIATPPNQKQPPVRPNLYQPDCSPNHSRGGWYPQHHLPRWVQRAVQDGYAITHRDLLCLLLVLPAALVPRTRFFLVAMEASFAYLLWAVRTVKHDFGMSAHCPWPLKWDGTCSHCSLAEPVSGDFELSPEELESQAAELKLRRVELQRQVSRD